MKKKILLIGLGVFLLGAIATAFYVLQPHRNVVEAEADTIIAVEVLVSEYLADAKQANAKYLASDGNSQIIVVKGPVVSISGTHDGRLILVLRDSTQDAGIQCLFVKDTQNNGIKKGDILSVKGVIRSGPSYDEDLEMFESGYLEECSFVN